MDEFSLIDRYFKRQSRRDDVLCSIGDDAAVVSVDGEHELVMCVDTLVQGVHFPATTSAADIAYKSIAVNISDLAAMGAEPAWLTLALTMPTNDDAWLQAFADSFMETCASFSVDLIGGDTTRGSMTISVHATGMIEAGTAMQRHSALPGQDIWVSGQLGDAALALKLLDTPQQRPCFLDRLNRPVPRVDFACELKRYCRCAIDVSDGLLADLKHILDASGCGAEIDPTLIPVSDDVLDHHDDRVQAIVLAANGGDDYELCFIAASDHRADIEAIATRHELAVTRIGRTTRQCGLQLDDTLPGLNDAIVQHSGYRHFE